MVKPGEQTQQGLSFSSSDSLENAKTADLVYKSCNNYAEVNNMKSTMGATSQKPKQHFFVLHLVLRQHKLTEKMLLKEIHQQKKDISVV